MFGVFTPSFVVLLQNQRHVKIDISNAFSAALNGELVEIFSPNEYSIFQINIEQEYYKTLSTTSILNSALVEDVLGKFKLLSQTGSTLVFDGFGLSLDTYRGKMKKILKCPKTEPVHPEVQVLKAQPTEKAQKSTQCAKTECPKCEECQKCDKCPKDLSQELASARSQQTLANRNLKQCQSDLDQVSKQLSQSDVQ